MDAVNTQLGYANIASVSRKYTLFTGHKVSSDSAESIIRRKKCEQDLMDVKDALYTLVKKSIKQTTDYPFQRL